MLNTALKALKAPFFLVISLVVLIVNKGDLPSKKDFLNPAKTQTFVLADALFRAQGVTNDGGYFYFSWNYGLIKTELDGETVVCQNLCAIPYELLRLGCRHIGGITSFDGKIYATIEDSKVFQNLYMARWDAATLKLIDFKPLPLERHENGAPWCAANSDEGVIYSARRDNIEELNVYDAETMEFLRTIPLTSDLPVHKIQGGEMYGGLLYLSASRGSQPVFSADVSSGAVSVAFDRNLADGSEGEGMTVLPMEDGTLFHILDIAKIRLGVHFRHYLPDAELCGS